MFSGFRFRQEFAMENPIRFAVYKSFVFPAFVFYKYTRHSTL